MLNFTPGRKSKYVQYYDRNATPKNNETQKQFEHKMASPEEVLKCRLDFLAFT